MEIFQVRSIAFVTVWIHSIGCMIRWTIADAIRVTSVMKIATVEIFVTKIGIAGIFVTKIGIRPRSVTEAWTIRHMSNMAPKRKTRRITKVAMMAVITVAADEGKLG